MSQCGMEYFPLGKTSRRTFLKAAAALGGAAPALARARQGGSDPAHHKIFAYVGSYSLPQATDGSVGRGQGIYVFEMNPVTGSLVEREVILRDTNPSFMAFDCARKHLYSVNWIPNYQGTNSGSVSSYAIDRASGHLTLLNTVSSEGANPTLPANLFWWPAISEGRWPCFPFSPAASWARPRTSSTIRARWARNTPPARPREALPSAGTTTLTPT